MAQLKKILISVPDYLLKEVDDIVSVDRINRSQFVREAVKLYLLQRKRLEMRDRMKKGYEQMAEINIKIAEIFFDIDNEQQQIYENRLRELER